MSLFGSYSAVLVCRYYYYPHFYWHIPSLLIIKVSGRVQEHHKLNTVLFLHLSTCSSRLALKISRLLYIWSMLHSTWWICSVALTSKVIRTKLCSKEPRSFLSPSLLLSRLRHKKWTRTGMYITIVQHAILWEILGRNWDVFGMAVLQWIYISPLTPELNRSAQRCMTRFFTGDFASWTMHFLHICVKNQQIHQLFIQFINYV
jgi:hypothetical protein